MYLCKREVRNFIFIIIIKNYYERGLEILVFGMRIRVCWCVLLVRVCGLWEGGLREILVVGCDFFFVGKC